VVFHERLDRINRINGIFDRRTGFAGVTGLGLDRMNRINGNFWNLFCNKLWEEDFL